MKAHVRLLAVAVVAVILSLALPVALNPFSTAAEGNHNTPTTETDLL